MSAGAPLESALTQPGDGPDVCPTCRSWRPDAEAECGNCAENNRILGGSVPVVPISLYRKPSELRDWLTHYKPNDEADHPEYGGILGEIIARWTSAHGEALREWCGGFDATCIVPSATRQPPHPLAAVIDEHVPVLARERVTPLRRGEGDLTHRSPSDRGYVSNEDASGRRILLIDDVYTTGARAQSAAFALHQAGAAVPAVLVIGRRVNPDWRPEVAAMWDRQAAIPFHFEDPPWWRGS